MLTVGSYYNDAVAVTNVSASVVVAAGCPAGLPSQTSFAAALQIRSATTAHHPINMAAVQDSGGIVESRETLTPSPPSDGSGSPGSDDSLSAIIRPTVPTAYFEEALPAFFPRRPQEGVAGRPIQLVCNHFSIEIPEGNVYHYDVEIFPEGRTTEAKVPDKKKYRAISSKINRFLVEEMVKKYKVDLGGCIPAFDGRKNLYTRNRLPFQDRTFVVDFEEDEQQVKRYFIRVKYAATVNLDTLRAVFERRCNSVPQEVLQAIDIVMRHGPSISLVPVGRSFFRPPVPGEECTLGGGKEVWFGYYTSVRPAQWKPMLNIDISATAFYEDISLLDFVKKLFGDKRNEEFRDLRDHQVVQLNRELKGLRVTVNHLPYKRRYKITKITQQSAKNILFKLEDGEDTSVAEYFNSKYRRLNFPNFPCVQSGSDKHPVFLPIEVCNLEKGQHYKRKLDDIQTSEMIKRTAQAPSNRFRAIESSVRDLVSCNRQYFNEFGIKVSVEPVQVKGRVLAPPTLVFENSITDTPRDGVWDLRGKHFYRCATMTKWLVVSLSRNVGADIAKKFCETLMKTGSELGMVIAPPAEFFQCDAAKTTMRSLLRMFKERYNGLELVFIILTKQSNYGEIKQIAETEVELRTQCVLDQNVIRKCNSALMTNICQKLNAKLGGVNNSLISAEKPLIFKKPVIIIGADVTHPSPGDKLRPSIAACVGSLDSIPSRFHSTVSVQMENCEARGRLEIIHDLKNMVKEMLKAFYRATRHKPERIVFYRDGVSEGQFMEVRNKEVGAIRQACHELSPNDHYRPALTFIVVQKRHHTRFRPQNERDGTGRAKNIPPGTTIDSVVTHPVDFDFFLCSHAGIQGTSKPSHYYVVWDDSNFSADELQKLSYYLCHTYTRCSRSVSIPAPVYYAHLAAYRAKNHLLSKIDVSCASSSSGSSGTGSCNENVSTGQYVDAVRVMSSLQSQMYFV